eukprot:TRINITY_DN2910_c2_g1_i1.p1 TRINITY_DN2910_c2_g1~~TRINITY_DN2910_c2_g1_i1.p1  ORF type:complete len:313 (-),score=100.68 TRINITY_DN2910_c2_g1_i1:15-953(-)
MDLKQAKKQFNDILASIDPAQEHNFMEFVHSHFHEHDEEEETEEMKAKDELLNLIVHELRQAVPVTAEAPNEKIIFPDNEDFKGYSKTNTVHVDGFLYGGEEDLDDLCDQGKLSRNYCTDCGSSRTEPYNFISHSATIPQLRFIFSHLVLGDLKGKTVVDVGSRLGSVLYMGHLFSNASKLIGIEMNDFFITLQIQMVTKKFKMADRIRIIRDDVKNQKEILQSADVVIMNNVFDFFVPESDMESLWKFVSTALKPGCRLVTLPSLERSLENAKVKNINLKKWVKEIPLQYPESENSEADEDCREVHLYQVL